MRQCLVTLKRALVSALFILTSSCNSSSESEWYGDRVQGSDDHAVMVLSGTSAFKDLEVEIQKSGNDRRVYLNAYGLPFQPNAEGRVEVQITIEDKNIETYALALKGNQSLRLSTEHEQELLQALDAQKKVSIRTGRYGVEINYTGFEKAYKKLN